MEGTKDTPWRTFNQAWILNCLAKLVGQDLVNSPKPRHSPLMPVLKFTCPRKECPIMRQSESRFGPNEPDLDQPGPSTFTVWIQIQIHEGAAH